MFRPVFDKMWLQSCTNSLYDSGLRNDMLSLLYSENRNIQFAAKVNNKLTRRINAPDLKMQGSVWSSLKCTTMMDKLNKIVMSNKHLQYYNKEDKSIPIVYGEWSMTLLVFQSVVTLQCN